MINLVIILAIVLFAAVLVFAATKPDIFHIRRTTSIKAPPEKIFALINDFHNWDVWSPYEKIDPAMKRSFSGMANGNGAVFKWKSSKAGAGRMEIIESSPSSKVDIQLDFFKPFKGHSIIEFTLETHGDTTNVTWDLLGHNSYVGKVLGIFCNRDNFIGKDFEEGLVNLKTTAERKHGDMQSFVQPFEQFNLDAVR